MGATVTPICIVVDVSKSMSLFPRTGPKRIDQLNEGIRAFLREVQEEDALASSVEIAVVAFEEEAEVVQTFSAVGEIPSFTLRAKRGAGDTPKGVALALRLLEEELSRLREDGKTFRTPWLVLFSDGRATPAVDPFTGRRLHTDIDCRLAAVQRRTRLMEEEKELTVLPVLISEAHCGGYARAVRQMRAFSAFDHAMVLSDPGGFRAFFASLGEAALGGAPSLFGSDRAETSFDGGMSEEEPSKTISDDTEKFSLHDGKGLRVCFLADVSLSMDEIVFGSEHCRATGESVFGDQRAYGYMEPLPSGGGSVLTKADMLAVGLENFCRALERESACTCETAIVTFHDRARIFEGFSPVQGKALPALPRPRGNTNVTEGIELSLRLLCEQGGETASPPPCLVLFTDGQPTDDTSRIAGTLLRMQREGKLSVVAVALTRSPEEMAGLQAFSLLEPVVAEDAEGIARTVSALVRGGSGCEEKKSGSEEEGGGKFF